MDAYEHCTTLGNAVAEAAAIAKGIQGRSAAAFVYTCLRARTKPDYFLVSGQIFRSPGPGQAEKTKCKYPSSKVSCSLKQFSASLVSAPPRIVKVFFAGHGIRVGDSMYLVPAKVEWKELADLTNKCLSQHELFGLLKTELEDKILVKDVLFLDILDICQNLPKFLQSQQHGSDGVAHLESLEPDGRRRPQQ